MSYTTRRVDRCRLLSSVDTPNTNADRSGARQRKIDVQTPTEVPVRAPANRPRCARVLKYITRSYSSESVGNQKESKMYIGGGIGLVLLIVVLVLFFR